MINIYMFEINGMNWISNLHSYPIFNFLILSSLLLLLIIISNSNLIDNDNLEGLGIHYIY